MTRVTQTISEELGIQYVSSDFIIYHYYYFFGGGHATRHVRS